MAEKITAEDFRQQLKYDPLTGVLQRKQVKPSRYAATGSGRIGSVNESGYLIVSVNSRQYRAHRLAWLLMTGEWPAGEIDHINGDRSDNRWANLRDVTTQVNAQNKRTAMSHSKTGLLGASWNARDRRFVARIKVGDKYRSLGGFDTAEKAHAAYLSAKRSLHAGCSI